jgi:hypothetical protein
MSGAIIDKMIMAARSYLPKAHESVVTNKHMNALKGTEPMDRTVTDAIVVDFINYVGMQYGIDAAVYTVDVSRNGFEEPAPDTEPDEDTSEVDIMKLPLGTRFHVDNGSWYGRIGGTLENKTVFVESTGKTFPLDAEYAKHAEISIDGVDQK